MAKGRFLNQDGYCFSMERFKNTVFVPEKKVKC
jgi:hypothetical protein